MRGSGLDFCAPGYRSTSSSGQPGNFVPLFLDSFHTNTTRSGVILPHLHMERGPSQFLSEKMSDASDRTSPFEKVTFFARRAGDGAAAQRQRKFSHFGSHSSCSQGKSTRFSPTEPPARAAQSTLQTVPTEPTSTLHAHAHAKPVPLLTLPSPSSLPLLPKSLPPEHRAITTVSRGHGQPNGSSA